MEQGAVTGNPIVDVKVRLVDGSTHSVDGKDIAFQIAGAMAMREAVQKASPVILEPIVNVNVIVPERFTGDIMGLLNSKRGRVAGVNPLGDGRAEVSAQRSSGGDVYVPGGVARHDPGQGAILDVLRELRGGAGARRAEAHRGTQQRTSRGMRS